jgi:hypothetical protein
MDKIKAENTQLAAHNLELEEEVTNLTDRLRRTDEELHQWRTLTNHPPLLMLHCVAPATPVLIVYCTVATHAAPQRNTMQH